MYATARKVTRCVLRCAVNLSSGTYFLSCRMPRTPMRFDARCSIHARSFRSRVSELLRRCTCRGQSAGREDRARMAAQARLVEAYEQCPLAATNYTGLKQAPPTITCAQLMTRAGQILR
jgi:hypothetical protein